MLPYYHCVLIECVLYIYTHTHFKMFTVFSYKMQDLTEQNVQVVVRTATLTQETFVITLQFSM